LQQRCPANACKELGRVAERALKLAA